MERMKESETRAKVGGKGAVISAVARLHFTNEILNVGGVAGGWGSSLHNSRRACDHLPLPPNYVIILSSPELIYIAVGLE